MLHVKVEIEKQYFRKKVPTQRQICHLTGILRSSPTKNGDQSSIELEDLRLKVSIHSLCRDFRQFRFSHTPCLWRFQRRGGKS
jgi:hypothetical protein